MLESLDKVHVELLVGIGVPTAGAMFFVARHFWQKTKCFYLLKQRVEQQEKITARGQKEHEKIFERLNDIDKNIATLQAQIKILIDR